MDIRQLRYFVEVARQENLTRAAQALYIAQPALSRSMRMLEDELGVRLLERYARGAVLTPEGRDLFDRAQHVLEAFDRIKTGIRERAGHDTGGVLVIGMTPATDFTVTVGGLLAGTVLSRFPEAQLKIVEAYSHDLCGFLREGQADLAVLTGASPAPDDLAVEPVFDDQLYFIGPATDPWMARESVDIADLAHLPLVLAGASTSGVRRALDKAASRQGAQLRVVLEVGSIGLAMQMIKKGLGYTVYVAAGLHDTMSAMQMAAVPIRELCLRRSLAWPIARPLSRLASEALPVVRSSLEAFIHAGQRPGARLVRGSRG